MLHKIRALSQTKKLQPIRLDTFKQNLKSFNVFFGHLRKSRIIIQTRSEVMSMPVSRYNLTQRQKQTIFNTPLIFWSIKTCYLLSLFIFTFVTVKYNETILRTYCKSKTQTISETKKQIINKIKTHTVIRHSIFWKSVFKKDRIIEARIKHKYLTDIYKLK